MTVDVNGNSFTVTAYNSSGSTLKTWSFTKAGPTPTPTPVPTPTPFRSALRPQHARLVPADQDERTVTDPAPADTHPHHLPCPLRSTHPLLNESTHQHTHTATNRIQRLPNTIFALPHIPSTPSPSLIVTHIAGCRAATCPSTTRQRYDVSPYSPPHRTTTPPFTRPLPFISHPQNCTPISLTHLTHIT